MGKGIVETAKILAPGHTTNPPAIAGLAELEIYIRDKWSIKKLVKRIVMSATYRQTSVVSDEMLKKDPQ